MSEKLAYQRLRSGVLRKGDRLTRIENLIGVGIPDTNGCFDGCEFWAEIKAPIEPKRPGTPLFGSNHKLSEDQINFFIDQRQARGLGWIYIETDRCIMLISGEHAENINHSTVGNLWDMATVAVERPNLNPMSWENIRKALCGKL